MKKMDKKIKDKKDREKEKIKIWMKRKLFKILRNVNV